MKTSPRSADPTRDAALAAAAAVLDAHWTGTHTLPAGGLYPHQWSWDSAFIAIGLRSTHPDRARRELRTLLDARWHDGRIPQIVYDVDRDDDYAPGAGFWRSDELPQSGGRSTSGLVQPPVHALACLLVHDADPEGSEREGFLQAVVPALAAWHRYLRERRAAKHASGLVVVRHPWEAGTDNSVLWDAALARIPTTPVSTIRRPDLDHADATDRPDGREYARYYWLAEQYRATGCADDPSPFQVACPLVNALLAASEHALAIAADRIGCRSVADVARAGAITATAALERLWVGELGIYGALDDVDGSLVRRRTVNGLMPALLPALPEHRAAHLLDTMGGEHFLGGVRLLPSTACTDPAFDGALYWRGPSWANTAWLLRRAALARGATALAERLAATVTAAAASDYPEYLDPRDGTPRGTRPFSWSAALAIDVDAHPTEALPWSQPAR